MATLSRTSTASSAGRVRRLWIAVLLRLYPSHFRAAFAADLVRNYGYTPASMWAVSWDLFKNGLACRFDDLRQAGGASGSSRGLPGSSGHGAGPGSRDGERASWVETWLQDLRYAWRMILASPVFSSVAILSLALGIGANTAVFGIVDAVMLRKLAVTDPDQLRVLHFVPHEDGWLDISINGWVIDNEAGESESSSFSYPMYRRLRDAAGSPFVDVTAFVPLNRVNARVGDDAQLADGQVVTGNYFNLLGAVPAHGRLLTPADDDASGAPAAVISYEYWQSRFGGQEDVLGTTLNVNGEPFSIVGVAPRGFYGLTQLGGTPDLTLPMAHQGRFMRRGPALDRGDLWWLRVVGRLTDGADEQAARQFVQVVLDRSVEEDLPGQTQVPTIRLRSAARGLIEQRTLAAGPVLTMVVVVAAVLLIACANLANLLLSRSDSRRGELAVRAALGAGRLRLVRQLVTESVVLSVFGGLAGLAIAWVMRGVLLGVLDDAVRNAADVPMDLRVLTVAAALALGTGLLFGTAPALRLSRSDASPALRSNAARSGGGPRLGVSRLLLVAQIAVSLVLLVVAGLFVGSLRQLEAEASGFNPDNVLLFRVDPGLSGYEGADIVALYDDLLRRLRSEPGVVVATVADHNPISGTITGTSAYVLGYDNESLERRGVFVNIVEPDFFAAFEIPLLHGRRFSDVDSAGGARVTVVNRAFAEKYFEQAHLALGQRVGLREEANAGDMEIVGVVEDVKYQSLNDTSRPALHMPLPQWADDLDAETFAVRTTGDPLVLAGRVREIVREAAPSVPVFDMRTQVAATSENASVERHFAGLSSTLGMAALILSCIGLYGVLSYAVARRTRELGVRVALGARNGDIVRLMMREMLVVVVGLGVGMVGAYLTTQSLESLLYGLDPLEPMALGAAALVLLVVAGSATYLPARRASRIDPVVALRAD